MSDVKTIFDYLDYREFLNDYIEEKKKTVASYSIRALASKIQCEPGFFNRIIRGERNLMAAHVVELGKVLKFSKKEQHYFELLVSYNDAKKQIERDHYFEQMQQFKKMNVKQVNVDQYQLYSHWYFLVIRELLNIVSCQKDSDNACRRIAKLLNPSVSVSDVREAIDVLAKLGVIRESEDKTLVLTDTFTT
ncbi:MAG: TIGR02147 family protein, partial [Fibrobacter sp.]|nr:TIGR02147 family protein [Fibrobacter sp.]